MKMGTVVIPHAYTPIWTQIAVSSLKRRKNDAEFDIIIVNNSPGHNSIRAISDTALGEGIKFVEPENPNLVGHQIALDSVIEMVDTPWYIAWETDVRVMRDGWLDWMLSKVKDEYVAIVGWYWSMGPKIDENRKYISPAGALYRTSIVKNLKEECLRNKDLACCWGRDMSKRINFVKEYPDTAAKLIPAGKWGPFTESRGFGNVYPLPRDQWCPEPGNWIYNRCVMQWECIHLPGELMVNDEAPDIAVPHKFTYVGPSYHEAYYIHYWAGTVSHNFDKHKIGSWDAGKLKWWLGREHRIWAEEVPEDVRKDTIAKGLVRTYDEEYAYAMTQVTK